MQHIPSALDLLRLYHNRYPRIDMGSYGFRDGLTMSGQYFLRPERNGKSLGFRTIEYGYPRIDVHAAGFEPNIQIDTDAGIDPKIQLQRAYWEMIQDAYARRRFYVRLSRNPLLLPSSYNVPLPECEKFPVEFGTWPAIPRGLILNREGECPCGYLHWSALVPEGTLEHEAISLALSIGKWVRDQSRPKPSPADLSCIHEELREKIKQAA